MFVSDIGALTAEPGESSAARCRIVLAGASRVRNWIAEREVAWMARLVEAEGRDIPNGAFSRAIMDPLLMDVSLAS